MFTDYSLDSIRAYLRQLYGDRRLLVTHQVYKENIGTVAAAATANGNIQITGNADFVLLGMGVSCDPTQTLIGKILFSDSGSGEQFSNLPVNVRSCCNVNTALPQIVLPWPRYIGGVSSVAFAFTNGGAAGFDNTTVWLHGINVREYH
jgi:hypothetical protein